MLSGADQVTSKIVLPPLDVATTGAAGRSGGSSTSSREMATVMVASELFGFWSVAVIVTA